MLVSNYSTATASHVIRSSSGCEAPFLPDENEDFPASYDTIGFIS
jgi:hypothetical protein